MDGATASIKFHVGAGANHQSATFGRSDDLPTRRTDLNGAAACLHMHIAARLADSNISSAAGGQDRAIDLVQVDGPTLGLQLHQRSLHGHADIEVHGPISGALGLAADTSDIAGGRGNNAQPGQLAARITFRSRTDMLMNDVGYCILVAALKADGSSLAHDLDCLACRQRAADLLHPFSLGTVDSGRRLLGHSPKAGCDQQGRELEAFPNH